MIYHEKGSDNIPKIKNWVKITDEIGKFSKEREVSYKHRIYDCFIHVRKKANLWAVDIHCGNYHIPSGKPPTRLGVSRSLQGALKIARKWMKSHHKIFNQKGELVW